MMESEISSELSEVRNIIRYCQQFVIDGLLSVVYYIVVGIWRYDGWRRIFQVVGVYISLDIGRSRIRRWVRGKWWRISVANFPIFLTRGNAAEIFWYCVLSFDLSFSWGWRDDSMKSGICDNIMLLLGWNPQSLGDALIIVNLLIVATVLRPEIHAIILWVLLSANYRMMPFSVWGSYLFMTLLA